MSVATKNLENAKRKLAEEQESLAGWIEATKRLKGGQLADAKRRVKELEFSVKSWEGVVSGMQAKVGQPERAIPSGENPYDTQFNEQ